MAEETVDRIVIRISAEAANASSGLRRLGNAAKAAGGHVGTASGRFADMAASLDRMNAALRETPIVKLQQLGQAKVSKALATNIAALADAANRVTPMSSMNLRSLASALRPISSLAQSDLSRAAAQIKKIPEALRALSTVDAGTFSSQLARMNSQLGPLAANVSKFAAAVNSLPPSLRSAAAAARTAASTNRVLEQSYKSTASSVEKLSSGLSLVGGFYAASRIGRFLGDLVGKSSQYIEDMNLFTAAMGEYAGEALEYAKTVEAAVGIDHAHWARNQGVFMSLITGMGQTKENAAEMSKQLTQLGYDIASFYNLDVEDAFLKIQSGIAGELEPLRRVGWDLSDARMQIEADRLVLGDLSVDLSESAMAAEAQALGIRKSTREMTQAEKVGLRYHMIMSQMSIVHGDMARTIQAPANQLRIFQMQVTLAARAVGNLLIPALNAILPYAIAVVKAIRMVAQAIASLFGIDVNFEVDYSTLDTSSMVSAMDVGGVEDYADALDDVGGSAGRASDAVEELKRTVMGFDELNKLDAESTPASGGSGGGGGGSVGGAGGGGGSLDIPLDGYDFLAGLSDDINARTDELANRIKDMLPVVGALAAGFAGWEIGKLLQHVGILKGGLGQLAGLFMGVAGAVYAAYEYADMFANGIDWQGVLGYVDGIAAAALGLGIAFGKVVGAATAVVGGIAGIALSIRDMYENGLTAENMLLGLVGVVLVGIGVIVGAFSPLILAIAAVVYGTWLMYQGFKDFFENGPTPTNVLAIVAGLAMILIPLVAIAGVPGLIVAAIIVAAVLILLNLKKIGAWWKTYVAKPWEESNGDVWLFVRKLWDEFYGWLKSLPFVGDIIRMGEDVTRDLGERWGGFKAWWKETVTDPAATHWDEAFGENGTVRKKAADAWAKFKEIYNDPGKWFKDNVTDKLAAKWNEVFGKGGTIRTKAEDARQKVDGFFADIGGWWDENVVKKVGPKIEEVFGENGTARTRVSEAREKLNGVWGDVGLWFNNNVFLPLGGLFSALFGEGGDAEANASESYMFFTGLFGGLGTWFDTNVTTPIGGFFNDMFGGIMAKAQGAFQWVDTYVIQPILSRIGLAHTELNSLSGWADSVMSSVYQSISAAQNRLAEAQMNLQYGVKRVFGVGGGGRLGLPLVGSFGTSLYQGRASGGLVDSGELFVARENGMPELVGSFGSKTGVANNAQIVDGIAAGVERAMVRVMSTMDRGSGGGEIVIRVDGRELARAAYSGQRRLSREGHISTEFV